MLDEGNSHGVEVIDGKENDDKMKDEFWVGENRER